MDQDSIFKKLNVSRETLLTLKYYKDLVLAENTKINLISSKTVENFMERHIIDCVQTIDFIDINSKICTDLGSGAGLPGLALAIVLKEKNIKIKMNLYEKSMKKSKFLRNVSRELKLDTEIFEQDVLKKKNLTSGTILARAFKPLPIVLDLVEKKFQKYSNLVVFMGKSGKEVLKNTFKQWDFEYKEKESLTSKDSFILSIKNIKKK